MTVRSSLDTRCQWGIFYCISCLRIANKYPFMMRCQRFCVCTRTGCHLTAYNRPVHAVQSVTTTGTSRQWGSVESRVWSPSPGSGRLDTSGWVHRSCVVNPTVSPAVHPALVMFAFFTQYEVPSLARISTPSALYKIALPTQPLIRIRIPIERAHQRRNQRRRGRRQNLREQIERV